MTIHDIHPALLADMQTKKIDIELTLDILDRCNSGLYDATTKIHPAGVPRIDGSSVIDVRDRRQGNFICKVREHEARAHLERHDLSLPEDMPTISEAGERWILCDAPMLEKIGRSILPRCGFGVLNGGSATSYVDLKKNRAVDAALFSSLEPLFERYAGQCRDMPKGLTPAYLNPDGSPGASFLELKMRRRLLEYCRAGGSLEGFMPLFQMTSAGNHATLLEAYRSMQDSVFLRNLAVHTDPAARTSWRSGVQPLIAAYTHSSEGMPKRIFDHAYGRENTTLALPGGHGQCFMALAETFSSMFAEGCRYAMISNVDNIGAVPDALELGILALTGKPAGFDFAVRTPVDLKGGILVTLADGSRTIVDIGPAIDMAEVHRLEQEGATILFNCATGIFDLEWLVPRLDWIARSLPVRFSDQNKDAGLYSQAEQVTWEVVSLLPDFVAFAVHKNERFLAAKMLAEMLLTSGFGLDDERVPSMLRETGAALHEGQTRVLRDIYSLQLINGRWMPRELHAPAPRA